MTKNANGQTSLFPKKAFAKLCHHAMKENAHHIVANIKKGQKEIIDYGPWVRPDDDESPDGGYLSLVHSKTDSQSKKEAREENSLINNFCPEMKKSLYQLDSFLLSAYKACLISKPEKISECDENLGSPQKHLEKDGSGRVENLETLMLEEWMEFSRNEDSENLTNQTIETLEAGRYSTANAAMLGQYFASDENAKDVSSYSHCFISAHAFLNSWIMMSKSLSYIGLSTDIEIGRKYGTDAYIRYKHQLRKHCVSRTKLWRWKID